MTLDRVLDALHYGGPRDRRDYKVVCPAHDDDKPSLSISAGQDGRVLLHCHAGCKSEAVLATLGLTWADLAPEQRRNGAAPHTAPAKPPRGQPKRIVAQYNYHDAAGDLLFQAVRFDPKGFAQRRPLPDGQWEWNLRGVKLVPYGLPRLLATPPERWIFVVEGEKDANSLTWQGLIATCNAQGAGKWRAAYNPYFAGHRVCILPDNDDPGRAHAHAVAQHLTGVAATVCVLELPNLPPNGDVSDWLAQGGTAAELLALADAAPAWTPLPMPAAQPAAARAAAAGKSTAIRLALAELGHAFRLNLVRERIEHANGDNLHDGEQAAIIADLYDRGLSNRQLMTDVILAEAWARRYDPLADFLRALHWDGQDHIARLSYHFEDRHSLIEYPDGSKRTVLHAWLRRWLLGAVARGLGDPVQNPMLVLAAEQGIGKSEFAKWLCAPLPDYFVESAINPDSVDHQRWATGNFVWEVAELGATTRKADVEALKAFITRHEHTFRVPYARHEVNKRTRVSFIGTVNPDNAGFLTDTTGNRRFLTVEIASINWRGYLTQCDVGQVWAQACALYAQDKNSWQLDATELAVREYINSEFAVEDPVRDVILDLFAVTPDAPMGEGGFISNADLVFRVGSQVRHHSTRGLQMDIARSLKSLRVTKGKSAGIRGYWGLRLLPRPAPGQPFAPPGQPLDNL